MLIKYFGFTHTTIIFLDVATYCVPSSNRKKFMSTFFIKKRMKAFIMSLGHISEILIWFVKKKSAMYELMKM